MFSVKSVQTKIKPLNSQLRQRYESNKKLCIKLKLVQIANYISVVNNFLLAVGGWLAALKKFLCCIFNIYSFYYQIITCIPKIIDEPILKELSMFLMGETSSVFRLGDILNRNRFPNANSAPKANKV